MDRNGEPPGPSPASEDAVRKALAGATRMPDPPIPADVDQAVLRMIHVKARQIRRRRISRRVTYAGAAAAIMLILAGSLLTTQDPHDQAARDQTAQTARASRNIDIVDAYLLARRLKNGAAVSLGEDRNHDGRVDFADVDALARLAVAIRAGRHGKES